MDVGKAGISAALAVIAASLMSNKQLSPVQEAIEVISEELEKLGNDSDRIKKNSADILKVYTLHKEEKAILVSVIQRQELIISSLVKSFISLQQSLHRKNILKFSPLISKDIYTLATTSMLKRQIPPEVPKNEKKGNILDAIKDL